MTKRTRLFIGSAVGVLVVGLTVGLIASHYGLPALAQFGGDGPGELAYLPEDARLVAFANVRDVMDSELRRKVLEFRAEGNRAPAEPGDRPERESGEDFLREAGIDLETDIDRVVASLAGPVAAGEGDRPLILARGRFDDDLIETMIRQRGGQVEEHRGTRVLTHQTDGRVMGLAFVEPDLVALGDAAAVRRAIDTKAGVAASITSNDEVMTLVRDIDTGNAWAVGRFDAVSGRARLPRELASQLPAINWFAATGHINGGVEGLIRAEARDEMAAQDLRAVVQGFLALARLQTGGNEQLRTLMNSLQLGGTGTTVSLSFSVPTEVIDALAALQQRRSTPSDPDPDPDPDPLPNTNPDPDPRVPTVPRT
jgi:hypothetical protein